MNQNQFYIAALLHDIGKMLERSKQYPYDSIFRDKSKYGHEAVSAQFMTNYFDTVSLCTPEARDLVWQHHHDNLTDVYRKLLQIADWLSSGERRKTEAGDETGEYNKIPLKSVFSALFDHHETWTYRPDALRADKMTLFPQKDRCEIGQDDYKKLSDGFIKEFSGINSEQQLYALLEKYTWAVPSSTPNLKSQTRADISLFDHSRTTAAIAMCLLDQFEQGLLTKETVLQSQPKHLPASQQFLLVSGDFSGVQDFIFSVSSKGAAKSLKGRSFYLELLSDIICRFLIQQLDLKEANILYNGGANFYILMPYAKRQKINDAYRYVSKLLFQAHQEKLYLALGTLPLTMGDFLSDEKQTDAKGFSEKWRLVGERTGLRKLQRYKEFAFEEVFQMVNSDGIPECPICHGSMKKPVLVTPEKGEHACAMCASFIDLANELKRANGIRINALAKPVDLTIKTIDFINGYNDVLAALGFECSLMENVSHDATAIRFNDTDFLPGQGFRFGVLRLPGDSFDELAERAEGAKKLALLKIDVDNLGQLFQKGLPAKDNTISRIVTISRELRLFFEGYVNQLLQTAEYRDTIYPVYSGGDDTFLVGAWNQILKLAAIIRTQFGEFVCQNRNITLSAGLVIVDEKFPIIRGAVLAEDALHKAKHYKAGEKDKICLFDFVFTWDELEYIIKLKNMLFALIKEKGESRSILNKVMKSTVGFEKLMDSAGEGKLKLEKVWRFAYYIGRSKHNSEKYREIDALYDELVKIYEDILFRRMIHQKQINNVMILPAACRLAELETRKITKKQEVL